MIDVALAARARIAERCADLFRHVGTVADLAVLTDSKVPSIAPAAYVIPIEERADDNQAMTDQVQRRVLALGVAFVVRHAGDAAGALALETLQTLRTAVADALGGWIPSGCAGSVQSEGGGLAELMAGGVIVWQDIFTAGRWSQWAAATA